jgi:tRNA threonylcarbamoyladenosine biosynthesis protein TsaB
LRILAIDSALDQAAAAVYDSARQIMLASRAEPMQRGHAEALLPLVSETMAASGLAFADLDLVAVTVGPGSFTGLRIGISAARGLALALGIPVVGVSTFAAFAAPFIALEPRPAVAVLLDAKNDQIYLQEFTHDGAPAAQPAALPASEAARALGDGPLIITGNAAQNVLISAKAIGKDVHFAPCGPAPDIAMVARLGALSDPRTALARPLYIRPPSAKRAEPAILVR